jgi:integrase/recombinase XerC
MPVSTPTIRLLQSSNDLEQMVEAFAIRLRALGRSEHTISSYLRDLRMFMRALSNECPDASLRDITPATMDAVLASPAITHSADGSPRSPVTVQRLKATIRSFFAWAVEAGLADSNPAKSVGTKRLARRPPEFLTEPEKRRLLTELRDRTNPLARRDRVIFELFLSTGIRLSELANLDVDDVDLDGKHIRIMGKGGVPQVKFVKSTLRTVLRSYLADRRRTADGECYALFLSARGTRLCARQIALRLTHWLERAGIARKITPHGLRHTFATHLYAKTSDLLLVKRALGHRDISTTEIYTHLADEALEEAIERL